MANQPMTQPPFAQTMSQMLVAFTIEVDNEWEERFWIHADPPPLRTSLVMWSNFLRFVGPDGISVGDLSRRAGYPAGTVHPSLAGMLRWRFVTIDGEGAAKGRPKPDQLIETTRVGEEAAAAWVPLPDEVEGRWEERYGSSAIRDLRAALIELLGAIDKPLPLYYPVLDNRLGMTTLRPDEPETEPAGSLALPFLLSQVIQCFALDYETDSDISIALQANLVRVLSEDPTPRRDLPQLTGTSKEAVAMGINYLKKYDFLLEEPLVEGRGKAVRLTRAGLDLQMGFADDMRGIEEAWETAYSASRVETLRSALTPFSEDEEKLFEGLTPFPDGWRASIEPPTVLPHHPMVLHRGGWPDGS